MAKRRGPVLKFDGKEYELEIDIDNLTLDESVLMQRHGGMESFMTFDFTSPEQLRGLVAIAVKRAEPDLTDTEAITRLGGLRLAPAIKEITKHLKALEGERKRAAADPSRAGTARPAAKSKTPAATGTPG